mmetsp:Transcript_8959/g.14517  ORF Transcript_8959/g.14517 Transcript_8959/m.14517 type:complete len:384 (+) Transcript_8959:68-1219(+)
MKMNRCCLVLLLPFSCLGKVYNKNYQLQLRGMQAPIGVTADQDTLAGETVDQATTVRSKSFQALDVNGDGHVLLWEYLKTSRDNKRLATYKFECTDGNLDGYLDSGEFNFTQAHPQEMDECLGSMFAFKMIDKNHDGHLSQKEMWKTVGSMRFDQRWAFMIACSDLNQDGKVSPMEFSGNVYDCVEHRIAVANEEFVHFNHIDQDNSSCVDEKEMTAALIKLLGHDLIRKGKVHYGGNDESVDNLAIRWVNCADDNHDDCLCEAEYEHLLDPDDNQAYCLGTSFELYEYDMDFAIMDSSHDGRVSKQEYYTWVDRIEVEVDHKEADDLFHSSDLNNDGFIDKEEFHEAGSAYEGDGPNALFMYAFSPRRFNTSARPRLKSEKL